MPPPATRPTSAGAAAVEAFTSVLGTSPSIGPRPLPESLRPLAAAIVGHTSVSMRTDHVARRALVAAGKRAATTGSVIHFQRTPDPRADRALLAHELTHVAHPSTLPRFFDDDRPSEEERRADDIARLVQRSPILSMPVVPAVEDDRAAQLDRGQDRRPPAARSASAPRFRGENASSTPTVQRSHRAAPDDSATITAADLVRRITTPSPEPDALTRQHLQRTPVRRPLPVVAPAAVIRRSPSSPMGEVRSSVAETIARSSAPSPSAPTSGTIQRATRPGVTRTTGAQPVVQRLVTGVDPQLFEGQRAEGAADPFTENIADLRSASGTVDFVDWIMDQIEDRLLSEMQRRGGRFRGDF